jgi:dCTP deaminase
MLLSDRDLLKLLDDRRLVVDPMSPHAMQPSSIDLRLSSRFRVFANHLHTHIDPLVDQENLTEEVDVGPNGTFVLHPGEFVLGSTAERIVLPTSHAGRVEGRSSLGRLGLLVHSTAGFIDPGFDGRVTLELSNVAQLPIVLHPDMFIGQLCVFQLTSPSKHPYGHPIYGSRYQGQSGPTPSRFHQLRKHG